MSYYVMQPDYYRFGQPDSPWHAGSEGWSEAPFPTWGANPARNAPPRLAVGLSEMESDLLRLGLVATGVGALAYFVLLRKPKRMAQNRRRNRRR
jgi:hypothetical protein